MKQPKEPKAFKYPRLYMRQPREHLPLEVLGVAELIIIYPDGRPAERTHTFFHDFWGDHKACWNEGVDMSPKAQVECMKRYASRVGVKTYFIGEIK